MKTALYPRHPILLVDDEEHSLASFDIALKTNGITNTIRCADGRRVAELVVSKDVEIVLLDLIMPHVAGSKIIAHLGEHHPEIPVIVITGVNEVETAVECMRQGAFDYIVKPVDVDRLLPSVQRALEVRRLRRENSRLTDRFFATDLKNPELFRPVITQHPKMQAIFQYCEAVAEGRQPVLITGETGTGKEEIARILHKLSGRSGNFVAVNVAGLDDHLFSDTLFGHAKGAFTGAEQTRSGLIEKAASGTLFLDEIGDLSPASQVKLLRFLETHEYYPLGADQPKNSDARVLVATLRDINQLQAEGTLRTDLYYRLRTHHVHLPPLRERKEDIPLLLEHFVAAAAKEFRKRQPTCHQEVVPLLKSYPFPGNIRELKALIYDAISGHRARLLRAESFRKALAAGPQSATAAPSLLTEGTVLDGNNGSTWVEKFDRLPTLKAAAHALVKEALRRSGNNQRVAAQLLGITPQALNQRLKRL